MTLHPDKMWEDLKYLEYVESLLPKKERATPQDILKLREIIEKYKRVLSQWKEEPK